jgi:hypothetical protein
MIDGKGSLQAGEVMARPAGRPGRLQRRVLFGPLLRPGRVRVILTRRTPATDRAVVRRVRQGASTADLRAPTRGRRPSRASG